MTLPKIYPINLDMFERLSKLPKSNSFFLLGPRGSGKSSLLKETFRGQNVLWIDLLNDELLDHYLRRPQALHSEVLGLGPGKTPSWIILDEVQKAPKLLNVVHQLIESDLGIKFALTGSSARKLKQKGTNLLAGRAFIEYLFPLTHGELGESFKLDEVLSWGSLPKVFSLDNESRANYLRSYALTYLKMEIQEEQWLKKMDPFRKFLPIAAQLSGQALNYSKYSRDVGVDISTIKSYYEILEDTLMGFHLPPFSKSIRKQQRQAQKFYFFDVGVRRSLERKINFPIDSESSEFGPTFEQWLISEIYRLNHYFKKEYELSYLQTKDQVEIDLILDRPNEKLALIEIKSSSAIDKVDLEAFIRISKDIPNSEAFVFSNDPKPKKIAGIWALPWPQGLKEIGFSSATHPIKNTN